MSQQELSALLYAYALGALDKEDYIRLLDYLESNGDYPWQELGEFQNLSSLLPSFLVLQEPHPGVKDKVARKLYRLKEFRRTSPGGSPAAKPEVKKAPVAPKPTAQPQRHESFLKTIERRTIERLPEADYPHLSPGTQEIIPEFELPEATIPQEMPVYSPPPFVDIPPFHTQETETQYGSESQFGSVPSYQEEVQHTPEPQEDEIPRYSFSFPEESVENEDPENQPFGRPDPETARPRQNTQIRGRQQNPAPPQRNISERQVPERNEEPGSFGKPLPPKMVPPKPESEFSFASETIEREDDGEQFIYNHNDVNAFNPEFSSSEQQGNNPFSFTIDPQRSQHDLFQTQETLQPTPVNPSFEEIRRQVVSDVRKEEEAKQLEPPVTVVKEKSSPLVTVLIVLLLLIGLGGVYFLLDMKYKKEVAGLNQKILSTQNEIKDTEQKLSKEGGVDREVLNLLTDKTVRLASLNSVTRDAGMYGKVFYSLEQKKGFLQLVNFIAPAAGKQYHLWMSVDGKITHLIAISEANIGFRYVKLENLPEFENARTNLLLITEEPSTAELKTPSATRLLTGAF